MHLGCEYFLGQHPVGSHQDSIATEVVDSVVVALNKLKFKNIRNANIISTAYIFIILILFIVICGCLPGVVEVVAAAGQPKAAVVSQAIALQEDYQGDSQLL